MNIKQTLAQYYALGNRIMDAEQDIKQMQEMATAIGSFDYTKPRVRSSPSPGASYEKIVEMLADKQAKLQNDVDQWIQQRGEIEMLIDLVENETQRDVLYKRYILHWRYEMIADVMHYNIETVFYYHRKAIRAIESKV